MSKVYLVGGAVRDILLGFDSKDRDYVVVGSTPEQMLADGFTQVGADFPVFLHSETGDEYALARREKKTGSGYLGFTSEFGVDVTLEEDLGRRDLSINSMATSECGTLIDPFRGLNDLNSKTLRHTSEAFEEDPVRVLRLARLRARFGPDWVVAPETKVLVSQMAKKGTLNELTAERVWKELSRALMEPFPRLFFDTLLECDALHVVFPEVYRLKTALESFRWHPEGDALEHTLLVLTQAAEFNYDLTTRLAALVHDFGKGITPRDLLPKHYGHDVKGVPIARDFCNRLTVPSKMRDRVCHATRFHMNMHRLDQMNPKTFVHMFEEMGSLNDPDGVMVLYELGICDERGRLGSEENDVDHLSVLLRKFDAYRGVKFADVFPNGETNVNKIKNGLFHARVKSVAAAR